MIAKKIFYQLSRLLGKHMHGGFHYATKKTQDSNGHTYYEVELSQGDAIHHLRFNEEGNLADNEVIAAFPEKMMV